MIIRIGWFELLIILVVIFVLIRFTHNVGFRNGAQFVINEWKREISELKEE